ncbi:MAG: pantoate--beta-alanine ligase [Rubricella sp.]
MEIVRTKAELRAARARLPGRVGFVPTMGFLHEGHLSLIRHARARADHVIVSIFVNPTQFGPGEDFDSYPRDAERDEALLRAEGVDLLFLPERGEIFAPDAQVGVDPGPLGSMLIGALRPGHFAGVATVVTKLFNIVQPDIACFGQKDYQQLALIRRMVRDLDIPVEIVGCPTVREADGLAMSSRNVRLAPGHRAFAAGIGAALDQAEAAGLGEVEPLESLLRERLLAIPHGDLRSLDIRDAETLAPVRGRFGKPIVALVTLAFGPVVLIDNRVITPAPAEWNR